VDLGVSFSGLVGASADEDLLHQHLNQRALVLPIEVRVQSLLQRRQRLDHVLHLALPSIDSVLFFDEALPVLLERFEVPTQLAGFLVQKLLWQNVLHVEREAALELGLALGQGAIDICQLRRYGRFTRLAPSA